MFEVARETLVQRSPAQLWEVLIDFDQYQRWSPYFRPKGLPKLGGEIEYSFRTNPANPRFWRVTATISEFEPSAHLAFDMSVGRLLLSIEEHFRIERTPEGSRLIHSICCKGLFARLRLPKARRNFDKLLSETDRLLAQYLSKHRSRAAAKIMRPKGRRRS